MPWLKNSSLHILVPWFLLTCGMFATLGYKVIQQDIAFDANIMNVLNLGEDIDDLTKAAAAPFETKALLLVQHPNPHTTRLSLSKIRQQLLTQDIVITATTDPSQSFDIQRLTTAYAHYPLAFLSH
ncbi:hypothetical protein RS130_02960 [Paraglaciecola aquimarina]|uniref:Uncharacterized protein n=1 Tax=Paraglaciecola aquimarina TaxID=1235557 RepID=A0ABU3SSR1_9ALTE|nr:hypothetical protein [Paraglaciecola aquimarina]MDU0353031.1 hypothetical protein [Paraglaciecola aquimarina]